MDSELMVRVTQIADGCFRLQLRDPLAQVPGQAGDLKPGRAAHKLWIFFNISPRPLPH
jgi:hypothetical protein